MSLEAAQHLVDLILECSADGRDPVVAPSTGRSPLEVYRLLSTRFAKSVNWSRVTFVQMDEVTGHAGCPAPAWSYLEHHLGPLAPKEIIRLSDSSVDAFARQIDDVGGIDIAIHGIGANGHIAYNEPGTSLNSGTRQVTLAPETRESNFIALGASTGVTLGMSNLLRVRRNVVLLTGHGKADAIRRVLLEDSNMTTPASMLYGREGVTMFLDEGSVPVDLVRDAMRRYAQKFGDSVPGLVNCMMANRDYRRTVGSRRFAQWFCGSGLLNGASRTSAPAGVPETLLEGDYRELVASPRRVSGSPRTIVSCSTLDELLATQLDADRIGVLRYDDTRLLDGIIAQAGTSFAEYFADLLDLPGLKRFVRAGTVKRCVVDGAELVLKCRNPSKEGRFVNEQRVVAHLLGLGLRSGRATESMSFRTVSYLGLIKDGATGAVYSVSLKEVGETVEELLVGTRDRAERERVLVEVASVLQTLYDLGVVWGDFAPRNIIRQMSDLGAMYLIMDFEKSAVLSGPVPSEIRMDVGRRAMCVEEFGAICSRAEVETFFSAFFRPGDWQVDSREDIRLLKPKPDYLEILRRRGVARPTQGDYDRLELEIMDVRFPLVSEDTGEILYPLHVGYLTDHYFGFDADLAVTLILIEARNNGKFNQVVSLLSSMLDDLEVELLKTEVHVLAGLSNPSTPRESSAGRRFLAVCGRLSGPGGIGQVLAEESSEDSGVPTTNRMT